MKSKLSEFTMGYGESPWRVLGFSGLTIVFFGFLYSLGGFMYSSSRNSVLEVTASGLLTSPVESFEIVALCFYYSSLVYTALGFGDFRPVGFGRMLATVETLLGLTILAMLVFVLGRRAER